MPSEIERVARAIDSAWWTWADVHYSDDIPGDRLAKQRSLDRAKAAIEVIRPAPADAEVVERLCKALEAAETYVIDGVTTAKQNLEMNAAYPARKPRYAADLQEARDIYAECQAARRAVPAAAKDKP
ncbi:hypothetical protein [Sinorhizobium meliloti]|uniref:hypothetical protein n=1 Tax=Rhizobium meliloti TaxID=382 RepID=UPI001913ABEC|nr:hypothetical protein [Sinorhizobium meliloti]